MIRPRRTFAALVTGFALATTSLAPLPAAAASSGLETFFSGFRSTVDIVVLRPLGVARLALGSVVLLPMSSVLNLAGLPIGQDTAVFKQDWDRFVVEPAEYTFSREIGEDLAGS